MFYVKTKVDEPAKDSWWELTCSFTIASYAAASVQSVYFSAFQSMRPFSLDCLYGGAAATITSPESQDHKFQDSVIIDSSHGVSYRQVPSSPGNLIILEFIDFQIQKYPWKIILWNIYIADNC